MVVGLPPASPSEKDVDVQVIIIIIIVGLFTALCRSETFYILDGLQLAAILVDIRI